MRWPSYCGNDTTISLIRVCSMSIYVGTYATPDDSPATSPELDEIVQTDADRRIVLRVTASIRIMAE